MSSDFEKLGVANPKKRTSNPFSPWRLVDTAFTAVILPIPMYIIYTRLWGPVSLLPVALWYWLISWRDNKRTYQLFLRQPYVIWRRRRREGTAWQENSGQTNRFVKFFRDRLRSRFVHLDVVDLDLFAAVHNSKLESDSVIITGKGSDYMAMTGEEQRHFLDYIADSIRSAHAYLGGRIIISFVRMRRPLNVIEVYSNLERWIHPDIFDYVPMVIELGPYEREKEGIFEGMSDQAIRDFTQACSIVDTVQDLRENSSNMTMALVVTIGREDDLDEALKVRDLNHEQWLKKVPRLTISRVVDLVIEKLEECGVVDPTPLDLVGVCSYIRRSWDIRIQELHDYYVRQMIDEDGDDGNTLEQALWPKKHMRVFPEWGEIDGEIYHRVLQVHIQPDKVYPDSFLRIFRTDVANFVFSQIGEVTVNDTDVFLAETREAAKGALQDVRYDSNNPPERILRKQKAEREVQVHLADADGLKQLDEISMVVSALDPDDLDDEQDKLMKEIRLSFMDAEVTVLEASEEMLFSWLSGIPM